MKEVQKEQYELSKDQVCGLINAVRRILERADDKYDLSVTEFKILRELPDIYDSFLFGFYKGMIYQKGKNQIAMKEDTNVAPVQPEQQEDGHFKLHIVNAEYGIASARLCDMPERYVARRVMDSKDLPDTLFCYLKERDMIVLNEDNMLSPAFGELIVELFQLTDEELSKELMRLNEVSPDYLNGPIIRLLGIQEYRRFMGYATGSMNN